LEHGIEVDELIQIELTKVRHIMHIIHDDMNTMRFKTYHPLDKTRLHQRKHQTESNMNSSHLRIALFGATGGTGSLVLRQALEAGHHVTALVRSPEKLLISHENLTVVVGSALDHVAVSETVKGSDAVICALGAPPRSKAGIRERGTRVIVDAMQDTGVSRLVVQSSHGIGETGRELPLVMRWFIVPFYLKNAFADHERQEDVVRASDLDWTIARPPHLTDGDGAGTLVYGADFDPDVMTMKVDRADVARFLIRQVESSGPARRTLVVSTATTQAAANHERGAIIAA
jgi:putative NADH-flavin reductase